jgi:hypothetical protein
MSHVSNLTKIRPVGGALIHGDRQTDGLDEANRCFSLFMETRLKMYIFTLQSTLSVSGAYPGTLFGGGSTNSVEDREQRERGSGGGSPLVRGSAQFAIRLDFVKLSGCRGLLWMYFPRKWEFGSALSKSEFRVGGGFNPQPPSVRHWSVSITNCVYGNNRYLL